MKVKNLLDKFEDEFALKVQVAGSDDRYLYKATLTLSSAQERDKKILARKAIRKVVGEHHWTFTVGDER